MKTTTTSGADVIVTALSYANGIFTSTVKNQGTVATPAGTTVDVAYSMDGIYRTWGSATGPLAAGASITIGTQGAPYTIPTGTHTVMAWVDDENRFAESNETNNKLTQSITIGTTPAAPTTTFLGNPGFESGATTWVQSGSVISNSTSQPARSGTWKADLNGFGYVSTESFYQTVTIPATVTSAILSFWLHIDTAETTTSVAFDELSVQVQNSSGTVLNTLATYSNLNKNTGYVQKSFDLSSYKGQTIRLSLIGTEDYSLKTSFVLDDFVLGEGATPTTTPPPTNHHHHQLQLHPFAEQHFPAHKVVVLLLLVDVAG